MIAPISFFPATARPLAPLRAPQVVQRSRGSMFCHRRQIRPIRAEIMDTQPLQREQQAAQGLLQSVDGRRLLAAAVAAYVVVLPCCQGHPAAAYDFDASPAVLSKGVTVFGNNCDTCHTGGQNIIESEKTLEKDALIENLDGGLNYEAIIKQVKNGKNQMPAWADSLSPEDIKAVAAYVYTQADANAWDW